MEWVVGPHTRTCTHTHTRTRITYTNTHTHTHTHTLHTHTHYTHCTHQHIIILHTTYTNTHTYYIQCTHIHVTMYTHTNIHTHTHCVHKHTNTDTLRLKSRSSQWRSLRRYCATENDASTVALSAATLRAAWKHPAQPTRREPQFWPLTPKLTVSCTEQLCPKYSIDRLPFMLTPPPSLPLSLPPSLPTHRSR